jgi:hypothetical protein
VNLNEQGSFSSILLGLDGLQLRFDKLLWREDDSVSPKFGEEGTRRNELGESKFGRISSPITPLQMFVLASVAFALMAAPDKQEKLLVLRNSGMTLQPLATLQGMPL